MISEIEPRYHLPYFSHIFAGGYSSGYYFYTWAEVLDKDAFAAFEETGDVFNRRTAQVFRKLLSSGGKRDGMSLYREFRGAEPSREPLLKARGLWVEPEPAEESNPENAENKETK
jgi:peptidyl-dipeptidase Dcp